MDIYRKKVHAQKNVVNFALYIAMFPQLVAGPIIRYGDIEMQLTGRKISIRKVGQGAALFVFGLAKKVLLADSVGKIFEQISASPAGSLSALTAWIGCISFAFQIYFDFSGYSDMAIGLGRMFGFEFRKNFDHPYVAKSVSEFWRRWHISLTSWFREYVYIPLGGSHCSASENIRNLLIVWLLTGMWHGAAWNYIVWGRLLWRDPCDGEICMGCFGGSDAPGSATYLHDSHCSGGVGLFLQPQSGICTALSGGNGRRRRRNRGYGRMVHTYKPLAPVSGSAALFFQSRAYGLSEGDRSFRSDRKRQTEICGRDSSLYGCLCSLCSISCYGRIQYIHLFQILGGIMDKKKKKKGYAEALLGMVFLLFLFIIMIINLIVPDSSISEEENRVLSSGPAFSLNNILSGTFMEQVEEYASDQFAGRNILRRLKVGVDMLGGVRQEGDVYIGSDGQLLEEIKVPEQENLQANLDAIRQFTEDYPDLTVNMILVPDAANILSGSLPALAAVENQSQLISMVKNGLADSVGWIDASSVLNRHRSEKIYYKTDRYWTALGAFYTFQEAAPALGISEDVSDKYVSYTVSGSFNGSLAARSGACLDEKETIEIYAPTQGDDDVIVDYVDEGKRTSSLYDSACLEGRNQYEVYLGGDTSLLDIRTVSTSQKRILVVKDSFANCFIPLLAPYFREIVVVDPRYYSGTIEDIMATYKITDTLFLYSGNGFFTDNSISGVFTGE